MLLLPVLVGEIRGFVAALLTDIDMVLDGDTLGTFVFVLVDDAVPVDGGVTVELMDIDGVTLLLPVLVGVVLLLLLEDLVFERLAVRL